MRESPGGGGLPVHPHDGHAATTYQRCRDHRSATYTAAASCWSHHLHHHVLMSAAEMLHEAMLLRQKYVAAWRQAAPAKRRLTDAELAGVSVDFVGGVATIVTGLPDTPSATPLSFEVPTLAEVYQDLDRLTRIRSSGPVGSYTYGRLRLLEAQFNIHTMMNGETETEEIQANPHRDFYNVRKVDTHIHHSAAANGKHLLRFIKKKAKKFGHEVVHVEKDRETGEECPLTLLQVFDKLKLKPYDLNIDKLAVMADRSTMHRFDKFNLKYNPCGESLLRTIFLKTDNYLQGRYLAELTRELFSDLEETKYQMTEYRLSVYGRKRNEWGQLAQWVMGHGLISEYNRWMIQIPRIFNVYQSLGFLSNMGEMIENLFAPLFAVTLAPESDPLLHNFLSNVSGFDSVNV